MVLMSTQPKIVEPTERRPSIRISVRPSPRLRRLSALMPAEPFEMLRRELAGLVEPASCGSWLTKSAMLLVGDVLLMSSRVRTVSGVGDWNPSRMTRVPVTTISRSASAAGAAVGWAAAAAAPTAGTVWAEAAPAKATVANAVPEKRANFSDMDARIESIPHRQRPKGIK